MRELPECLNRRYQALDALIRELSNISDLDSKENVPNETRSYDPSIQLMCNFWNILKEDPDCNLTQAVRHRMGLSARPSSNIRPQHVTCYMACCNHEEDSKKKTCEKTPQTPQAVQPCCSSKSIAPNPASESLPLSKVLCNLKEAVSFDKKCNFRISELLTAEKHLQEQIKILEQREKEGIQLLKQADCMWSCMEEAYKKKIAESLERQGDLLNQLKEVETSTNKWRKNKKDLEFQLSNINRCHQDITEKIHQKTNDVKCLKMEIENFKKRIESIKQELPAVKKSFDKRKSASDAKVASLADEMNKLKKLIAKEDEYKRAKEKEGNEYIKEARDELQKICKVLLQKKLENEDIKAEKEALIEEIEILKKTCDQCQEKCQNKHKTITDEIAKVDSEIAGFRVRCVRCHECTDTADVRTLCTDCPRCAEQRDCLYQEGQCIPDTSMDCVCMSVKQKFLDNVFDNMYTVLERQSKTNPGKAVADKVLNCLKRSRNGKLDDETRKVLQDFVLSTVKKNLNLTIIGGAVKTRCEMDPETYEQLMLCLKQVQTAKPEKVDKGTPAKKDACGRWDGSTECNCPKGPKNCICTKHAPPLDDPNQNPPRGRSRQALDKTQNPSVKNAKDKKRSKDIKQDIDDEDDAGVVIMCPHKDSTECGPDCARHTVSAVGTEIASWRPSPCDEKQCFNRNTRAAQCILGKEPLSTELRSKCHISATPIMPDIQEYDPQICKCGTEVDKSCACHTELKSNLRQRTKFHPRERMIEEVMGRYTDVTPIEKVANVDEGKKGRFKKGKKQKQMSLPELTNQKDEKDICSNKHPGYEKHLKVDVVQFDKNNCDNIQKEAREEIAQHKEIDKPASDDILHTKNAMESQKGNNSFVEQNTKEKEIAKHEEIAQNKEIDKPACKNETSDAKNALESQKGNKVFVEQNTREKEIYESASRDEKLDIINALESQKGNIGVLKQKNKERLKKESRKDKLKKKPAKHTYSKKASLENENVIVDSALSEPKDLQNNCSGKSNFKVSIGNDKGHYNQLTKLSHTPSGSFAMELDEKIIKQIEQKMVGNNKLTVALHRTSSGHLQVDFSHSDNPSATKQEILVKRSSSGSLAFEVDKSFISILKPDINIDKNNLELNNKSSISITPKKLNNIAENNVQKTEKVDAKHACRIQSRSEAGSIKDKRVNKMKQDLDNNSKTTVLRIKQENGYFTSTDATLVKTESGNIGFIINDTSGFGMFGEVISRCQKHPALLNESDSGSYVLDIYSKCSNALVRKTRSGRIKIIVKMDPVEEHNIETNKPFCSKKSSNVFKLKVTTPEQKVATPPIVLKSTPSDNYIVVIDKEYETRYKKTVKDHLDSNYECPVKLVKTLSGNYLVNFEENCKEFKANATLERTLSGNIKIIANSSIDLLRLNDSSSSKILNDLIKTLPVAESKLTEQSSRFSKTKCISDSDLYEKVNMRLQFRQNLLSKQSAVLKKTSSGQYAVVLNKESKKSFINNLKSHLASNSQELIPIKRTESGEITISLSKDNNSKSLYGSLKISPSGNMFISVEEKVIKTMLNNMKTEKLNTSAGSSITLNEIYPVQNPVHKNTTTTCNAFPDNCSCDASKCVCAELIKNSNKIDTTHSNSSFKFCEHKDTESRYFKNYDCRMCPTREKSPHIVIKSRGTNPDPNKKEKSNSQSLYCVTEEICPFHKGRYESVSNELLEITGLCSNNYSDRIVCEEKEEIKNCKKSSLSCEFQPLDMGVSLDNFPLQLPHFLRDFKCT